ncbi:MAG: hypothetical protein JRI23_14930 [Deltaproteobacteria bacterium]|jgi:hypothetical protein|nr:hypothetical protein [Deltaproteobacteria bacterium]MBW2533044.1 hypothetical protein [Deltaproteobacteria bacterium]
MNVARFVPVFAALLALPACSKSPEAAADAGPTTAASTASLPAAPATAAPPSAEPASEEALEGEDLEDDEGLDGDGGPPDEEDDERGSNSEASEESDVVIKNVGMRFGGGPNDAASKEPTRKAIMAEFDKFRACHAKATGKRRFGTYGVDIRIGRDGGRAKIGKPRSALKGSEFLSCMKEALEAIEFPKPPGGKAASVSYSIRFEQPKER